MSATTRCIVTVTCLAAVGYARTAQADGTDTADALFNQGLQQMEAGQLDKACPAIARSYVLEPLPGTLFTLAECEAKRGRLASAVTRYDEYLAAYAKLSPDKKRKQGDREKASRDARTALSPQVPEVVVSLSAGSPEGTVVTRDGSPVAPGALGSALRLDPGDHVFTAQAPGGVTTEKAVSLKKGDHVAVTLTIAIAAAPHVSAVPDVAPPEAPSSAPKPRRIGAFAALGVGGVGLLVGAITGGLALGKKSTVNQGCGIGGDPTACSASGFAAANSLKTLGVVSTVGFVLGGAGIAAGVVLLATEPKAQPAGSARGGVRVRWIGAGASLDGAW